MKLFNRFCLSSTVLLLALGPILHGANPPKIIPRSEWNAVEAKPFRKQTPKRFTIHHTGVAFDRERDAGKHIRNTQVWGMGPDRKWHDIPYHFLIAPNGDIFEGRDPFMEGESNTTYKTAGHLQINLLGNFNEQEPTPEQLKSLTELLAWAHEKYNIPTDTLAAHRDFAQTACPGEELYKLVENGEITRRINEQIKKNEKK